MLIFAILLSVYKTYKSYDLYQEKKRISYYSSANILSNYLDDSFSYVENVFNALSIDIAKLDHLNSKTISKVLLKYKKIISNNNDLLSWTVFDFVDKNGVVLATSKDGVLKNKTIVKEDERQWLLLNRKNPGEGHMSFVDTGIISGEKIMPYGFGVPDKNGNFLGSISTGISVKRIRSKLLEVLGNTQIKFLIYRKDVLKNDLELVFSNVRSDSIIKITDIEVVDLNKNLNNNFRIEADNVKFSYSLNDPKSDFVVFIGQDSELLNNEFKSYIYPRLEQNIILIIFLITIYLILKRKVVNPILDLSQSAKRIAEGNRNIVIPRYDCKEVDYLANQISKIKKYIGIEEKKEKAEQENISKTSFLASVSHEIRSPISAIYSIGEILENKEGFDSLSEDNRRYFLSEIKNQANESLEFIQDLLDVGQAESGNFKVTKMENENIEELVQKSIKMVRGSAIRSGIQINYKSENNLPKIKCDRRRIKQILVNLLNNSVKYSNKRTRILVTLSESNKDGKKIKISIKDQGFGMTKFGIKKALKKYGTVKNRNSGKVDSLGLGLPLVKHLIDQHDGTLDIKSEIGKGSEFIIDM